jgi:hypothetical protein
MPFKLVWTPEGEANLKALASDKAQAKKYKTVLRVLAFLETNPRHPSLETHKYDSLIGPKGQEVFEAYVQNRTPGAWRIFWCYGPEKEQITILAITPHP